MICRRLSKIALFAVFALGIAPNFALLNAYNFSKCKEFYLSTSRVFTLHSGAKIRALHIGDGQYLAFSVESSNDAMQYDPFLGLILFQAQSLAQKYDFVLPQHTSLKNIQIIALGGNLGVDSSSDLSGDSSNSSNADSNDLRATLSDSMLLGSIQAPQKSLKNHGIFSRQIPPNAILSDICYQSYGISVGANRFIDAKYIARFLADAKSGKARVYSDIGVGVERIGEALVIESLNPFIYGVESVRDSTRNLVSDSTRDSVRNLAHDSNHNSTHNSTQSAVESIKTLQIGDEIISIDGIAPKNEDEFFDIVTTLEVGKNTLIVAKRGNQTITIRVQPFKRARGFDDNGTAMDVFGIIVDDDLLVRQAPKGSIFRQGDKILRLNQIKVRDKAGLDSAIRRTLAGADTSESHDFSFLIVRGDFELFITSKLRLPLPLNLPSGVVF